MKSSRRKFLQVSLGTGTLALSGLPLIDLKGQSTDLIKKTIPSSGETITAVGIGTSRRYDVDRNSDTWKVLKSEL